MKCAVGIGCRALCVFLLLVGGVGDAVARGVQGAHGCPDNANFVDSKSGWIYVGNIGKTKVRVFLHYNASLNLIQGEYGIAGDGAVHSITGKVIEFPNKVQLKDIDPTGRVVGNLQLVFEPLPGQVDDSDFRPLLNGEDVSSGRHARREVRLHLIDTLAIKEGNARRLNERVAFEVQSALKLGDSRRFSELMYYPLTVWMGQRKSTYSSPRAVIRNYKKIVSPVKGAVLDAVPHELATRFSRSSFAGNTICIDEGKVTEIGWQGVPCFP